MIPLKEKNVERTHYLGPYCSKEVILAQRRSILITLIARIIFFGGVALALVGALYSFSDGRWYILRQPVYKETFRLFVFTFGLLTATVGHLLARRRIFGFVLFLIGCVVIVLQDIGTVALGGPEAFWFGFVPAIIDIAVLIYVYSRRREFKAQHSIEEFLASQLKLS